MSYRATTWAWGLTELGLAESMVLISLADQANDDGFCWPSQATLAARSRQSERSVRRNLARLEEAGLIKIVHRSTQAGRRSNLYWLNVGAEFSLQNKQPARLSGCEKPVENSPVDNVPVDNLGEVEGGLFVANKATGQIGRLRKRTNWPVAQPDTGDRSQPDTDGRLQYRKNHQEEPPNRTEPNQASDDSREVSGLVRSGEVSIPGEAGSPDGSQPSGPVDSASGADLAVVRECLPVSMHGLDRDGLGRVAGLLRARLAAGWTPEQIRATMDQPLPADCGRLSSLVAYRIENNILESLAPAAVRSMDLGARRRAEESRLERSRRRSEALACRQRQVDERFHAAFEQASREMPGASRLDVAIAAQRLLDAGGDPPAA